MSGKCVFKPGDYVVPIRADRNEYAPEVETLVGEVLKIPYGFSGNCGIVFLQAGKLNPRSRKWFWHRDDLRHATADEIAAAPKPKPLRQGDLVDYSGNICMVFDERTSKRGERLIVVLNSKDRMDSFYAYVDDLVCVGSIRKQLKRAKKKECAK